MPQVAALPGRKSRQLCLHPRVLPFGSSRQASATFPARARPAAVWQNTPISAAAAPSAREPAPRMKPYY